MILNDYLRAEPDQTWHVARQCGVQSATIRMPEDGAFDLTNASHWQAVCDRYRDFGFRPDVVEPLPNELHDHIKAGDAKRDECVDKVITMLKRMDEQNVRILCFNFMAHIGWLRTSSTTPERGGAGVTSFDMDLFQPGTEAITTEQLWQNYAYFIRAVVPEAEKHHIKLALHPDDPPVPALGQVERIMISRANFEKAIFEICPSPNLGVTMCQANFRLMGEDLFELIPAWKEKIFFIHFRNVRGNKEHFRETFHDNGELPMAALMRLYREQGVDVPVRVDHVPTLVGEDKKRPGYDALGRYFAIGYLKGILEAVELSD